MGPSWNSPWPNQYVAFKHVVTRMQALGLSRFGLRFHPNMLNKSPAEVRRELAVAAAALAPFGVQLFGPEDRTSSYDLIRATDRVVVSGSTVGLEATQMNVPVCCTGVPYGSDCWGGRFIHTQEDVEREHFEKSFEFSDGPERFVDQIFARTQPITSRLKPRFGGRLSWFSSLVALVTSGPIPFLLSVSTRLWRLQNTALSKARVRSAFAKVDRE